MLNPIQFFSISDHFPSGKGFSGAVSDGRWMYYIPMMNHQGFHGQLVRTDTTREFQDPDSWESVDLTSFHPQSRGFVNGLFDGTYLYLIPYHHTSHHGLVGRFDTRSESLHEASAWDYFDLQNSLDRNCRGYVSGTFDGRYLYLSPYQLDWNTTHGHAVRFDTKGTFTDPASWSLFDMTNLANGAKGYHGALTTRDWILFVPYVRDQKEYHGLMSMVKRGDDFSSPESWKTVNLQQFHGEACGYIAGSPIQNGFVLAPYYNGKERHGLAAYCQDPSEIENPDQWQFMDLTNLHPKARGYFGAVLVDEDVVFIPHCRDEQHYNGCLARWKSGSAFQDPNSWSFLDTEAIEVQSKGYIGSACHHDMLYLSPYETAPGQHSGLAAKVDVRETSLWQFPSDACRFKSNPIIT